MAVQERNCLGQFNKGNVPHNKSKHIICVVDDCDRTDMKGYVLCNKDWEKYFTNVLKENYYGDSWNSVE